MRSKANLLPASSRTNIAVSSHSLLKQIRAERTEITQTHRTEHKLMRVQKKPWGSTKRAICLGRPLAASVDLSRTL